MSYARVRLQKYILKPEVRTRLVYFAIRAIVTGLMHLHSINATHRDMKPENLLLRIPPFGAEFSSDDIKIGDLGYSACEGVNLGETANDLPGTLPYMAPTVLKAREECRKIVVATLERAVTQCDGPTKERVQQIQKDFDRPPDDSQRISRQKALSMLEEVRTDFKALVRDTKAEMLRHVTPDWCKDDVYSTAISIWQICNPDFDPFPMLDKSNTAASERKFFSHLRQGHRPEHSDRGPVAKGTVDQRLWWMIVDSGVLEESWGTEASQRLDSTELCEKTCRVLDAFEDEQRTKDLLQRAALDAPPTGGAAHAGRRRSRGA